MTRPVKELKGFQRVTLEPGQRSTVTFELFVNQLGYYDREMAYVVEPATIDVMVGTSSQHLPLSGRFAIVGGAVDIEDSQVFFGSVSVESVP